MALISQVSDVFLIIEVLLKILRKESCLLFGKRTKQHLMNNLLSMFRSQAYRDCWADSERPLKTNNFPRWDYVILTASNDQRAEGFRKQISVYRLS